MKRIVVCFDGTGNTPESGENPTNVVKIMRALAKQTDDSQIHQVAFYDAGIGTYNAMDKVIGGISGRGFGGKVKDGYRFIANNFVLNRDTDERDEIYIFGFSRGAYTAYSLARFIECVGLLPKWEMNHLPNAWQKYRNAKPNEFGQKASQEALKDSLAYMDVRIQCLGLWDTVAAVGKTPKTILKEQAGFIPANVDNIFHALAIDERRNAFTPLMFEWPTDAPTQPPNRIEQVWFAGAHSNVGGGYPRCGLSNAALHWMCSRVRKTTNLEFRDIYLKDAPQLPDPVGGTVVDSSWVRWLKNLQKSDRMIMGLNTGKKKAKNAPRKGTSFVNEKVHESVIQRIEGLGDYRPKNVRTPVAEADIARDDDP
jgi:uncharacterized protein (DUF2235 family)